MDKHKLRELYRHKRRNISETERRLLSQKIAERFLNHIPLQKNAVIAGYWPMGSEADCRLLLQKLGQSEYSCALPVMQAGDDILHFECFGEGSMLIQNETYGFMQPVLSGEVKPDIMLVPLVAFDRQGYRIGQGGGFYDRTLEALRKEGNVLAVGIAFACQECEKVPHESHDQRLDWVITEKEAIRIR